MNTKSLFPLFVIAIFGCNGSQQDQVEAALTKTIDSAWGRIANDRTVLAEIESAPVLLFIGDNNSPRIAKTDQDKKAASILAVKIEGRIVLTYTRNHVRFKDGQYIYCARGYKIKE